MKNQHTKGEWKINFYDKSVFETPDGRMFLGVQGRQTINVVEANAKLIVKAVNMHDELILQLKNIVEKYKPELLSKDYSDIKKLLQQAEQK